MDVETSEAIQQLGKRIDRAEVSRSDEIRALESRLATRFPEKRGHTEGLFDTLRDDIRTLAEGFATLSAKLDSSRR